MPSLCAWIKISWSMDSRFQGKGIWHQHLQVSPLFLANPDFERWRRLNSAAANPSRVVQTLTAWRESEGIHPTSNSSEPTEDLRFQEWEKATWILLNLILKKKKLFPSCFRIFLSLKTYLTRGYLSLISLAHHSLLACNIISCITLSVI